MKIEASSTTASSLVGRFNIRYTIQKDKDEKPVSLSAKIYESGNIVGTADCTKAGEFGISATERAEMTESERNAVVSQIMSDFSEAFGGVSNGGD